MRCSRVSSEALVLSWSVARGDVRAFKIVSDVKLKGAVRPTPRFVRESEWVRGVPRVRRSVT